MDIEAILAAESDEALKEIKTFLFKENIRLKNEQKELADYKERLLRERSQFRMEMDMLQHKAVLEQKRIKDDNLFFEKKMDILKEGYRQLDEDKRRLEKEKQRFRLEKELWEGESRVSGMGDVASALFRGVTNPLALRKRYKDLLKIFHPDNLCGDAELVQMINREYERRKRAE